MTYENNSNNWHKEERYEGVYDKFVNPRFPDYYVLYTPEVVNPERAKVTGVTLHEWAYSIFHRSNFIDRVESSEVDNVIEDHIARRYEGIWQSIDSLPDNGSLYLVASATGSLNIDAVADHYIADSYDYVRWSKESNEWFSIKGRPVKDIKERYGWWTSPIPLPFNQTRKLMMEKYDD